MSFYQIATPYPGSIAPDPQQGDLHADRNIFTVNGATWSYHGCTAFLLFYRWLLGENIDAFTDWCRSLGVNTVRVLGMVNWPDKGQTFGPGITPNWWPELLPFIDYLAAREMRCEFVVFASAQDIMPSQSEQRAHLRRVVDTISSRWNVVIEIANEPEQNGCDPTAIFGPNDPRDCPMAYGLYNFGKHQDANGTWIATLPTLDYVTVHSPRDPEAWSRKAKDLCEYRDGSGDGSEMGPLWHGCHIPPVGDEPMGAAEADEIKGRQRSDIPEDFFWYCANALINGAGATFHSDNGLQTVLPPIPGDQQKCAEAFALAWANIEPEFQTGMYTRGGLHDLPMVWEPDYFPEQTSRIYGRILGSRAVCVAIKPNAGWTPKPAPGWKIVSTVGPMNSLVHLERV